MKIYLGILFVAACAATASAQTYTAPATPVRPIQPPPPITARDIGGVIPRMVRTNNPGQMVNPRAPARYGTAEQSVLLKPDGSGKWNGLRLFVINF